VTRIFFVLRRTETGSRGSVSIVEHVAPFRVVQSPRETRRYAANLLLTYCSPYYRCFSEFHITIRTMGGTTSLFEQNNWERASGRISNASETIDGADPTDSYNTYYLTKRALNQREFDVTDSDHNLLYTTRAVPNTLSCFDVLGPRIDDYVLRVSVLDIAKRHWIVLRFNERCFEGQTRDEDESKKAQDDLQSFEMDKPIELFKKCCIMVSWSRYVSVAAFYGEPTVEMMLSSPLSKEATAELVPNEEDLFEKASEISARMRARKSSSDLRKTEDDSVAQLAKTLPQSALSDNQISSQVCEEATVSVEHSVASMDPQVQAQNAQIDSESSENRSSSVIMKEVTSFAMLSKASAAQLVSESTSRMGQWIQDQSEDFKKRKSQYLNVSLSKHPLEGVVRFDGPLLKCQEIYNRVLVGNHQTSRASENEVFNLIREDEQHGNDNTNGPVESHEVQAEEDKEDNDTPLVGYWRWQHTLRCQRMVLHLAKNSDLALHVVMAIIANQVRYERNAIAMTI